MWESHLHTLVHTLPCPFPSAWIYLAWHAGDLHSIVIHPLMIHPHLIHFWLANMSLNTIPIFMEQIVTGSKSSYQPLYKIWMQLRQYWWHCRIFKMDYFSKIAKIQSPLNDTPIILIFLCGMLIKHSEIWYSL